jgi:hypothetical protein
MHLDELWVVAVEGPPPEEPIGTRDIDSTPPPITRSAGRPSRPSPREVHGPLASRSGSAPRRSRVFGSQPAASTAFRAMQPA